MAPKFKQLCGLCKKNYVLMTWKDRFPVCYDCHKKQMSGDVKDPQMKKLFNIPEEYYKDNSFLRSVKINYLRFGSLTEKQVETFKKIVKQIKEEKK